MIGHVPALYPIQYSVLSLRLSEKSWIYLLAAQLLFSDSWSSILAGASGLIAGYVYLKDLFHVQSYRLPASVEVSHSPVYYFLEWMHCCDVWNDDCFNKSVLE